MKQNRLTKIVSALLALLMVCLSYVPVFADQVIVTVIDFLSDFNYFATLLETGHELKSGNFEVMSLGKSGMLVKAIYNGCEILSIHTDANIEIVTSVSCTMSTGVKGSSLYVNDFWDLLTVVMLACGMETDSVISALKEFSDLGIGSSVTYDGLTITCEETVMGGLSFEIERK